MSWVPEWFRDVVWILGGLGVSAGGIGAAIGFLRQNAATAWRSNYEALEEKVEILEQDREVKDHELRQRDREISHLNGRIAEMSVALSDLRGTVIGEVLPKVLKDELTGIANRIEGRVNDLEDNIAAAVGATAEAFGKRVEDTITAAFEKHDLHSS